MFCQYVSWKERVHLCFCGALHWLMRWHSKRWVQWLCMNRRCVRLCQRERHLALLQTWLLARCTFYQLDRMWMFAMSVFGDLGSRILNFITSQIPNFCHHTLMNYWTREKTASSFLRPLGYHNQYILYPFTTTASNKTPICEYLIEPRRYAVDGMIAFTYSWCNSMEKVAFV